MNKFPGMKETDIRSLRDSNILHTALFNACKQIAGIDPTWSPHLKFRELYYEAEKQLEELKNREFYTGLHVPENDD